MSVYFEITLKNHWIDLLKYSGVSNIGLLSFLNISRLVRWRWRINESNLPRKWVGQWKSSWPLIPRIPGIVLARGREGGVI